MAEHRDREILFDRQARQRSEAAKRYEHLAGSGILRLEDMALWPSIVIARYFSTGKRGNAAKLLNATSI